MENDWDKFSRGVILKPTYKKRLISNIPPPHLSQKPVRKKQGSMVDLNKVIVSEPIAVNWGAGINPFSDYNKWSYEYQIMIPVILGVIFLTPLILLIVELCK